MDFNAFHKRKIKQGGTLIFFNRGQQLKLQQKPQEMLILTQNKVLTNTMLTKQDRNACCSELFIYISSQYYF